MINRAMATWITFPLKKLPKTRSIGMLRFICLHFAVNSIIVQPIHAHAAVIYFNTNIKRIVHTLNSTLPYYIQPTSLTTHALAYIHSRIDKYAENIGPLHTPSDRCVKAKCILNFIHEKAAKSLQKLHRLCVLPVQGGRTNSYCAHM